MTYRQRLSLFILIDSCLVLASLIIGLLIVKETLVEMPSVLAISASILLCHHLFSFKFHLYNKDWAYASIGELIIILKVVAYTVLITFIIHFILFQSIPINLFSIMGLLHFFFIGGSRFCWRVYRDEVMNKKQYKQRTLIIGAGSAGVMVARQLLKSNDDHLIPVAFIDDDKLKHHFDILGLPVVGGVDVLEKVVERMGINHIIIAIPSLNKTILNKIFKECAKTTAKTQILPRLEDIITGKVSVNQFRDVQVEDLLGRKPIQLDIECISEYITNQTVLVSGAGGSIGSEICRQISQFKPKRLVLLGHGENSIYSIHMELEANFKYREIEFITEIADIQDEKKMLAVISAHKPSVVYHAAAHKHVPLMEKNPEEAVKNNIIGTKNIAEAAHWEGVDAFVMVSTDKAVNPTSVMGATKRLAEMVVQHMDTISQTRFVAVRFGNVLGSRGSVIPLFKKQIENGGPVTVTHPDMIRYFMTIPEASRLVIQAGALAKGGEIFVLDMGEPVKVVDLAKNLIKLSGYHIDDIGIEFTGIRPGEKLFEELLKADEVYEQQVYPNIYIGKSSHIFLDEINEILALFESVEKDVLRDILLNLANKKAEGNPQPVMTM
ncbi:polysaccharide biosynthesis protein [Cytobacillus horneckiae]|uniref:Polysaccharide biosynthesis protein n=1 Tax=Cytobacillus horneckiae TaxID=549687 RepID=A0A2N0ZE38_9BACI|nr:nucleoside-diphosphate sugar epimerase/dehydratase [Cytobacillus horneckiae]MEC1157491.1 nucleoside-diphosphate sugar epimerase/dehydratase [Cytobacillus horneckiae]MED2939439.1 nucleoside-diphosphate sugar epimerase/dehydratase [Cytobacillus horneckiae]PKG27776.1 polysaccharide biosynthesis protein [Cytobacillus horneckiae]